MTQLGNKQTKHFLIHGVTGFQENNCKHFYDFQSYKLKSLLPKTPGKVNNPIGTTP